MSKTAISPETLKQFDDVFAGALTLAQSRLFDQAVTTAYNGIALLNRTIGSGDKVVAGPLFEACGRAISLLAEALPGGRNYHARCALSSVGCNYLMLAREIFVAANLTEEAEDAMQAAYETALNISHEKRFPVPPMIFAYFHIYDYCSPEHLCDLEKAVALLVERKDVIAKRKIELYSNGSKSEQLLQQAESLVNTCEYLFVNRCNVRLVFCRTATPLPAEIKEARAAIIFARYNAGLGHPSALTVENVNQSHRACQVSGLILARVKALMATLYVRFWQKSSAYEYFSLLAHQAVALSQHCLDQRWRSVASWVTENCWQRLRSAQELELQVLCDYANLALSYATCFHGQMQIAHGVHDIDVAPDSYAFHSDIDGETLNSGDLTLPPALEFTIRYWPKDRLD